MSNIATVKTAVRQRFGKMYHPPSKGMIREAVVKFQKDEGVVLHTDGRFYVPESKRGRGVGYGRHGK